LINFYQDAIEKEKQKRDRIISKLKEQIEEQQTKSDSAIRQYSDKIKGLEEKRQNNKIKTDLLGEEVLQSLPFDLVVHILDFFEFKVSHIYHKLDNCEIINSEERVIIHNNINKFFFGYQTQDDKREIRLLFRNVVFTDTKENWGRTTERDYFTNKGQPVSKYTAQELVPFLPSNIKSLELSEFIDIYRIEKFKQLEKLLANFLSLIDYKSKTTTELVKEFEKLKTIKFQIIENMFHDPSIYKNLTTLKLVSIHPCPHQNDIDQIALIRSLKNIFIEECESVFIFDILLTLPHIESISGRGIIHLQKENKLPSTLNALSICGYNKDEEIQIHDIIVSHNLTQLEFNNIFPHFYDLTPFLKNSTTITYVFLQLL
jgi:hypothetical protein